MMMCEDDDADTDVALECDLEVGGAILITVQSFSRHFAHVGNFTAARAFPSAFTCFAQSGVEGIGMQQE